MLYKVDKCKLALYHSRKISIPVIASRWNGRKAARQAGSPGICAFVLRIQSLNRADTRVTQTLHCHLNKH